MQANVGDRLITESNKDSVHRHEAEILEIRGEGGGPPYWVRWGDGHEALTYPGPDTHIEPG